VDQHRRRQRPQRRRIVDLELRAERQPEQRRRARPAGDHAFLAAEDSRKHEHRRVDELADAERDQREDRAGFFRRHRSEHDAR
jgi:hypothetical protein